MIRAVLFDLDDTLFDHSHCARAALEGVRSAHACFNALPAETVEKAHSQILEELHPDVVTGKLPLDDARIERFRRLFETAGVDADVPLASSAAAQYRRGYLEAWRAVEGAIAVLSELRRRGLAVAIVSNNLLEEQQEKVRHCAIEPHIDALVVSGQVGISKPDPGIFEVALRRLGADAEAAVMVGDSWAADIVGASAAGIRPVWFNRHNLPAPATPAGVVMLNSLEPADEVASRILDQD